LECNFTKLEQLNKQLSALLKTLQNNAWQAILSLGTEDEL
jgi:hypothetical protein